MGKCVSHLPKHPNFQGAVKWRVSFKEVTPPKINIEPEHDGLEDVSPFPGGPYSQVPC